ncbi:60S acidic ribosomal protein P2-like [Pristis pectinata]|uniref:60S acidic ribosomal protein P2-like n=1 Tax=Pristis pectinata TaxID=685728 RepID=UPI00223D6971|nr:60S acidic ribosomal protein P2-like [Pristis pectinata]
MLFMCVSQDEALSFSGRACVGGKASAPTSASSPKMRYVAAYLLAVLGGNEAPSSKDIKKILDSVGIEADDERLNKVISELKGKNVDDVITAGNAKLASVPTGGAVAVSTTSAAVPAAAAAVEEKKEEKKEESEESDDDMGFGLFD